MDFPDSTEEKIWVMKRAKLKNTTLSNDPGVSLAHEKDAIQKKRRQHRWVSCQIPNHSSPPSEAHKLDRISAIVSRDPEVLEEEAAADAERQERHDRNEAISTIRLLYPPASDSSAGQTRISAETLYQAVSENGWKNLPTAILVRMAELQLAADEREISAGLANR